MGVERARIWTWRYAKNLFITDLFIVVGAVFGSQLVWFGGYSADLALAPTDGILSVGYTVVSVAIILVWLIALDLFATRDHKIIGTGSTEYKRIADATIRLFGVIAIVAYLLRSELARGYFLTALPVGMVLLLAGRWSWRQWLVNRRREGKYKHRAIVVGERQKTEQVASSIQRDTAAGIQLVGAVTKHGSTDRDLIVGVPVLGNFGEIIKVADEAGADTVILTSADDLGPRELRELGWQLEAHKISMIVAPALTDIAGPRIHARQVAGLPLVHVDFPVFEGPKLVAKRIFDIFASGFGLVLLSPIFVWITIAVRRDSEGNAFFRQERVGLNGRDFNMIKFRSMASDAEVQLSSLLDISDGNGVLFKLKTDPRVTRVGRFLRRYSLDELPQLINVFRGDMSLVGPRPSLAREVEQYDNWAHRRLMVKPGITGLWQVSGRSGLSWEDSIRLDLYYVENWSLTGDLIILWRTVKAVGGADGAF
jgi:exopolysaccharide biosynthesis polyprenyl glycosylphosphotransferase